MKRLGLKMIYIFFAVTVICCKQQETIQESSSFEKNNEIRGLTILSKKWVQDSTSYWTRTEYNGWKELQAADTVNYLNYTLTERYHLLRYKNLKVKKIIDFEPKSRTKISEADIYIKTLNPDWESRLFIKYNYITEKYYSDFLDSTITDKKYAENEAREDSLALEAERTGAWLCGTGNSIPKIPKEIEIDSAFQILKKWNKNK